jgi:hypothetical protein
MAAPPTKAATLALLTEKPSESFPKPGSGRARRPRSLRG